MSTDIYLNSLDDLKMLQRWYSSEWEERKMILRKMGSHMGKISTL